MADLRYWPSVSHVLLKAGASLKSPVKKVGAEKNRSPWMTPVDEGRRDGNPARRPRRRGSLSYGGTLESPILQAKPKGAFSERSKPGGSGSDGLGWGLRTQTNLQSWQSVLAPCFSYGP